MSLKSILFQIALFLNISSALQASWAPSYLFVQSTPGKVHVCKHSLFISDVGLGWQLYKRDPNSSYFFANLELNASQFFGKCREHPEQNRSFAVFGGALVFRWIVPMNAAYLKKIHIRPWFQIGSGPQFFTTRNVCYKPTPLSTKLQFATHLGVGARFAKNGRYDCGVFYRHYSNANIKYPNYTLDSIVARIGYWF